MENMQNQVFFGNMAKNNKSMNLSIYISMYTYYVFIPKFMQIDEFVWDIKKGVIFFLSIWSTFFTKDLKMYMNTHTTPMY